MVNGLPNIQREFKAAVEAGLRQQYGNIMGAVLAEVGAYYEHTKLDPKRIRDIVDNDAGAVVSAIVANRVDAPLMLMIRSQMIGSALLEDREAVVRWATEGLHRSKRVGGPWTETESEWKWVLEDPARFILYARQLKLFMNQY